MVALFASLKWRLVTSRLRATHGAVRAWIVVGFCLLAVLLGFVVFGLVTLQSVPDAAVLVVVGLYTFQLIGWVLSPLVAFGVDETVDPQRFALLPLTTNTLQRGLLVSSLVGYLPLINLVVLIGAAIAVSVPLALLPVALLCAIVQLVTCVVFSRAAATAMSALMSSRRGRDLGMLVGFGIFVLYMLLSLVTGSEGGAETFGASAQTISGGVRWAPPGALAALPSFLAAGDYLRAAVAVVTALVFLALGWWWWSRALQHNLTTVPSTTENAAPAERERAAAAVADSVFGTAKLVADRDRILTWRDPMRRMPWLMAAFIAIVWPFLVVRGGHGGVFAVMFGAVLIGTQAANQLAVEGSGLWLHLVAFGDRVRARGEILGHAAVALAPGVVIVTAALLLQAAVAGDWALLPAAFGVCLAGLGGAIAVSCYASAAAPYAMPQSRKSLFASSVPGQKGRTTGVTLSILLGGVAAGLPAGAFAVPAALGVAAWGWLGLLVGLLTGAGLLAWLPALAARRYVERGPEILAVVASGDRS